MSQILDKWTEIKTLIESIDWTFTRTQVETLQQVFVLEKA